MKQHCEHDAHTVEKGTRYGFNGDLTERCHQADAPTILEALVGEWRLRAQRFIQYEHSYRECADELALAATGRFDDFRVSPEQVKIIRQMAWLLDQEYGHTLNGQWTGAEAEFDEAGMRAMLEALPDEEATSEAGAEVTHNATH